MCIRDRRSSFGISRTLMKFPGLNLTPIESELLIISASVEIRDLLCESEAMTVNCHAFTGNTWSESSASWSSVSPNSYASSYTSRSVSYGSGNAAGDSQRYSFDITSIARGWKSGSYDKNKGVLFKAANAVESGGTYTVSYTHLDVYKRQAYYISPSLSCQYLFCR